MYIMCGNPPAGCFVLHRCEWQISKLNIYLCTHQDADETGASAGKEDFGARPVCSLKSYRLFAMYI